MTRFMGCWYKDRVVSGMKVLEDMAENILNVVVNGVDKTGRVSVPKPEAFDYPAGRKEFFPFVSLRL
ncbi:hypothetical protein N7501_007587 [Penicillium viridicatum]|nr:hypothetical protein N7501_007587 [Penicillium viridicatum]